MAEQLPIDVPFVDPYVGYEPNARPGDAAEQQKQCDLHGAYQATRKRWGYGWQPWSRCPSCVAQERALREERERLEQDRAERQRRRDLVAAAGLPERFANAGFKDFDAATPMQRTAVGVCATFARTATADSGAGLLLVGKPGTGKTHLSAAIVRHLAAERGLSALFVGSRDLIRALRATWRRDATMSEEAAIALYARAVVLVIDDAGTGFCSAGEQTQLLDVIDARYVQRRPTIVSTNLNLPGLREAVGDRVFDRLQEGAQTVVFDWPSHRRPA